MMHRAFNRYNTVIKDEATPEPIAIPVDDDQPPAGPQHSVHLVHGPRLIRIMMKTVRARADVEAVIGHRKRLTVRLDQPHAWVITLLPFHSCGDHLSRKVYSPDFDLTVLTQDAPDKCPRATADVEHAEWPRSAPFNFTEYVIVRRHEQ